VGSSIKHIRDTVIDAPLRAIDEVIDAVAHAAGPGERRELLTLLAMATLRHAGVEAKVVTADPLLPLFDVHIAPSARSTVAAVLWRALDGITFEPNDQHRILDLFDSVYGGKALRVYTDLGLTIRDQAYKKISTLRDTSVRFQDDLAAIIKGITSIEQISRARHGFMRHLSSSAGNALVRPFLGELIERRALDRLFGAVTAYAEASPTELVPKRDAVLELLRAYAADAEDLGTQYARSIARLAERIAKVINDHFSTSPATKSAALTATVVNKKHSLATVGAEVILGIAITNDGPGHAFDVHLSIEADSLEPDRDDYYLGSLGVGSRNVDVACTVRAAVAKEAVYARITWHDFDRTPREIAALLEFTAQRAGIDWDALARMAPYHLNPVENERELAGRDDILNQLVGQVSGPSVGSSFIYGQRRVGKTSIVKTFKHQIGHERPGFVSVVYFEVGEYVDRDGPDTIKRLGNKLCAALQDVDPRLRALPIPSFEHALAPLTDFLEAAARVAPDLRVLFVLDEFDELPVDLYRRSLSASPPFLTIRSVSGKPQFGFVLVGGEKMSVIITTQGQQLNKFVPIRVDYFDRERNWRSFAELVRRPVQDWIEITDDALETLWQHTAGNPYFTRVICRELFLLLVQRRDSHATSREMTDAILDAIGNSAGNAFAHFWDDGINAASPAAAEETSVARRKALLALGQVRREGKSATSAAIVAAAESFGLPPELTQHELRDFVRRDVLLVEGGVYRCKVGLFERWLQEKGQVEIMTTIMDRDAALAYRSAEEKAYVTSTEILNLVRRWGPYQGNVLTEDQVRMWLQQFGPNLAQRRMFQLLEHVTFYSDAVVRKRMRTVHREAVREMTWKIEEGQKRRADIIVNYVGGASKRGAHYAKLYANENDILTTNVVSAAKLSSALGTSHRFQALIIVDDFIGTGTSAIEHFRTIEHDLRVVHETRPLRVVYVAVAGFADGRATLQSYLDTLRIPITIHVGDVLGPEARCFGDKSTVYASLTDREDALQLALPEGERLMAAHPLGRGDCQATVVFETTCPPNSLPILWAESPHWIPLFKQ
jgi:hypothetical protein